MNKRPGHEHRGDEDDAMNKIKYKGIKVKNE